MKRALLTTDYYCDVGFNGDFKRLHSHSFDEISLIVQGDITYISDCTMDKVTGHSLIYSKAYQLHNPYIRQDAMYERYQLFTHPDCLYDVLPALCPINTPSSITPLTDRQFDEVLQYMKLLFALDKDSSGGEQTEWRKKLLLSSLYLTIGEIFKSSKHTPAKITGSYIRDVILYIEDHFSEKIRIDDLASLFFVSRTKLIGDFSKTTGMTVSDFHTLTRLKHAKRLLAEGLSVAETAERCGYLSSGYFINTFSAHNRITPLKYQKMLRKK